MRKALVILAVALAIGAGAAAQRIVSEVDVEVWIAAASCPANWVQVDTRPAEPLSYSVRPCRPALGCESPRRRSIWRTRCPASSIPWRAMRRSRPARPRRFRACRRAPAADGDRSAVLHDDG